MAVICGSEGESRWQVEKVLADKPHGMTAVAIREGVIDERVYRSWFNGTYISDFEAMKDYIDEARRTYENPRIFCEYEALAIRWKEDRVWGAPPNFAKRKWTALLKVGSA